MLDSLSTEAQNYVSDIITKYRHQMIDELIKVVKKKRLVTAKDVMDIQEKKKSYLSPNSILLNIANPKNIKAI